MFAKLKKILSYKSNVEANYEHAISENLTAENKEEKVRKLSLLTQREYELFLLLVEGYTLKECAAQLSIKYSTANTHMTSLYKKLEVNTKAELIINYRDINAK
ncbi:MAG: Bacterial regulatory protein luxR family [Sedimentibacter sp.]|jgi:DNA-binding CsgD family transcriptional regulator|nr:Bacterial regulatory protein luxR family [Sedimentibacter sp.]